MSISELDNLIAEAARSICEIVPHPDWASVLYMQRFSGDSDVSQSRFILQLKDGKIISDSSDWDLILTTRLSRLLNRTRQVAPASSGFLYEVAIQVDQSGEFRTNFKYSENPDIDRFMTGQIEPPPGFD